MMPDDRYGDLRAVSPENTKLRQQRNAEIYALAHSGVSRQDLTRRFALSRATIDYIIARVDRDARRAAHQAAIAALIADVAIFHAWLEGYQYDLPEHRYLPPPTVHSFQEWVDELAAHRAAYVDTQR